MGKCRVKNLRCYTTKPCCQGWDFGRPKSKFGKTKTIAMILKFEILKLYRNDTQNLGFSNTIGVIAHITAYATTIKVFKNQILYSNLKIIQPIIKTIISLFFFFFCIPRKKIISLFKFSSRLGLPVTRDKQGPRPRRFLNI